MKRITVVEVNDISMYPPVQNLINILLDLGYEVNLIGGNTKKISASILENSRCTIFETPSLKTETKIQRWKNRIKLHFYVQKKVKECMDDADYLWTTSMNSIRTVGKLALNYKNILQLMELSQYGYVFHELIKFPIDELARKSWKIVVPEINRAYIQKTWWKLNATPFVLPNKPYSLAPGDISPEQQFGIKKMCTEKRKIILYLGGIYPDRDLESYANAINKSDNYVLYIIGSAYSQKTKKLLKELKEKCAVEYIGNFNPPKHLAFVKYAHIGLLPYKPTYDGNLSELNALYCAPNKIFEYAGYGVPMIGSDVPGLRQPFEKWDIGYCCDDNSEEAILKAVLSVEKNYSVMSKNCFKFFDSVNLKEIVSNILEEK